MAQMLDDQQQTWVQQQWGLALGYEPGSVVPYTSKTVLNTGITGWDPTTSCLGFCERDSGCQTVLVENISDEQSPSTCRFFGSVSEHLESMGHDRTGVTFIKPPQIKQTPQQATLNAQSARYEHSQAFINKYLKHALMDLVAKPSDKKV